MIENIQPRPPPLEKAGQERSCIGLVSRSFGIMNVQCSLAAGTALFETTIAERIARLAVSAQTSAEVGVEECIFAFHACNSATDASIGSSASIDWLYAYDKAWVGICDHSSD